MESHVLLRPTERFSTRVENYVRYRPGYPPAVVEVLRRECGLTPESVVADVGSGTGFLTELFLKYGCRVFGVEPNRVHRRTFENRQVFDLAGLIGRLLSSSYAPEEGHPRHEPMLAALKEVFHRHQQVGTVSVEYETQVYFGRLAAETPNHAAWRRGRPERKGDQT